MQAVLLAEAARVVELELAVDLVGRDVVEAERRLRLAVQGRARADLRRRQDRVHRREGEVDMGAVEMKPEEVMALQDLRANYIFYSSRDRQELKVPIEDILTNAALEFWKHYKKMESGRRKELLDGLTRYVWADFDDIR